MPTIRDCAERAIVCDRVQALADLTRCRSMTTEEQGDFDRDIAALAAYDKAHPGDRVERVTAPVPHSPIAAHRPIVVDVIRNEEQRATACLMAENRARLACDPKRWPAAQEEAEAHLAAIAAYDRRHPRPRLASAREVERDLDRSIAASQIAALRAFAAKR